VNHRRLQYIDDVMEGRIITLASHEATIARAIGSPISSSVPFSSRGRGRRAS
jgi:hypothetical protein